MSFLIPTVIPLTSHNFISLVYDNHMMNASVLGINVLFDSTNPIAQSHSICRIKDSYKNAL